MAIIGDEDTVTGFLLAGIGDVEKEQSNFLIVAQETSTAQIEEAFKKFTQRSDIAIILINQHIAEQIRYLLDDYHEIVPSILEIPSKEHPYDPEKDSVLKRVRQFFGQR